MTVAALFVRSDSVYKSIPGVDCYDLERDALSWPGGCSVVAHPPCRSWGQLSHMAKPRLGEKDLGLWAIERVREFGGVCEHPYSSRLWAAVGCSSFGVRDQWGGVLIPVYQSFWGHVAPKKTCFYVVGNTGSVGVPYPDFLVLPPGRVELQCKADRERTPVDLAFWLVELARSCVVEVAA